MTFNSKAQSLAIPSERLEIRSYTLKMRKNTKANVEYQELIYGTDFHLVLPPDEKEKGNLWLTFYTSSEFFFILPKSKATNKKPLGRTAK